MNTKNLDYVDLLDTDLAAISGGISGWDLVTLVQLMGAAAQLAGELVGAASVAVDQAIPSADSVDYYESLPVGVQ